MLRKILIALFALTSFYGMSQGEDRRLLLGKVMYRNTSVPNENVINSTAETATITNENGEFAIRVKEGDELLFMAVNYQLEIVTITPEILENNRLVVEVNEKVTELDEVIVTPEDQERFLKLKNEEFKSFEYEVDRSTEVENIALSQTEQGMQDGINFVNIFRAIFKSTDTGNEDEAPKLLLSEVLRKVYDDQFFVVDLKIPRDKIDAFLLFCDERMPARSLMKKENEFQLIDGLVNNSKLFLEGLDEEK
ncbi:carboxypeptidase-like regulatory domain-containing protein [Maribacter sp. 2307ULW6-5]|uniref:carboxypeptidase-like regulatory domain-containing protein n=1 Tax=Maribacter sp. 2307ULW6-5 TaxID=3386275 RepID=UPI0039BD6F73